SRSRRARLSIVPEEANSATIYEAKSGKHYVVGTQAGGPAIFQYHTIIVIVDDLAVPMRLHAGTEIFANSKVFD
ncbi:MAG: hypothetical protein L0Y72_31390, partial [Gemmataceae bacterium]|nr:hypothetical protein [Gemmataceae bacterium]MCI0743556.1 hypothetical protein [Gemmataceae bacterium]